MVPMFLARTLRYRRHRLGRRRGVHRRNLNFRKITKLTQMVRKMEDSLSLRQFTAMALGTISDAKEYIRTNMPNDDDAHYPNLDAANSASPTILLWQRRLQRDIDDLEASIVKIRDKYQGGFVNIYSMDQMLAMEYLHRIGWRGRMNPRGNAAIAQRIDSLLQP